MNEDEYYKDLKRRQEEHLRNVRSFGRQSFFQPCAHDACSECVGTGIKRDGTMCIHALSCSCPKCVPYCHASPVSFTTLPTDSQITLAIESR